MCESQRIFNVMVVCFTVRSVSQKIFSGLCRLNFQVYTSPIAPPSRAASASSSATPAHTHHLTHKPKRAATERDHDAHTTSLAHCSRSHTNTRHVDRQMPTATHHRTKRSGRRGSHAGYARATGSVGGSENALAIGDKCACGADLVQ